jgi:hypothetical protein
MKKLILVFLAAGSLATANAQQPKSILLYGDLGLASVRDSGQAKTTNWNANIGVGYQFNQNWTLGVKLAWGQSADKAGANGIGSLSSEFQDYATSENIAVTQGMKFTDNSYSVGPFARYSRYIRKSETFFWYTQMDFDYQGGYTTNEGNPANDKHSGIYVGLYPALGVNVGRGMALNFSIGGISYGTDKYTTANYSTNTFNFNFGQTANIGISKNFNCGQKMHSHHEPGDEVHRRKADNVEDEDDAAPKPKRKERNRDEDE